VRITVIRILKGIKDYCSGVGIAEKVDFLFEMFIERMNRLAFPTYKLHSTFHIPHSPIKRHSTPMLHLELGTITTHHQSSIQWLDSAGDQSIRGRSQKWK
jgi:hypothetical protein